jgi:hypothetical protein
MGPFPGEDMPLSNAVARRQPEIAPAAELPAARDPAPAPLDPAATRRLEAMRAHLLAARPGSGNEALRLLRAAFPHSPLGERVQAADEASRWSF